MNSRSLLLVFFFGVAYSQFAAQQAIQSHEEIVEYWTPERMANAIPKDIWLKYNGELNLTVEINKKRALENLGAPPPTGTNIITPTSLYNSNPYAQTGKVFFTDPTNGANYVCSGSSVGANVVLTAGHCVAEGNNRVWYTNWIFQPRYDNGNVPRGSWTERQKLTFNTWFQRGDFGRDVAFVVVNANGGTLEQAVGAMALRTDIASNTDYFAAIGYPVNSNSGPAYGGRVMVQTYTPQYRTDTSATPNPRGIVSNMGGGCSGGPWVWAVDIGNGNTASRNAAAGLNSYGYTGQGNLYSPRFDSQVGDLYQQALRT